MFFSSCISLQGFHCKAKQLATNNFTNILRQMVVIAERLETNTRRKVRSFSAFTQCSWRYAPGLRTTFIIEDNGIKILFCKQNQCKSKECTTDPVALLDAHTGKATRTCPTGHTTLNKHWINVDSTQRWFNVYSSSCACRGGLSRSTQTCCACSRCGMYVIHLFSTSFSAVKQLLTAKIHVNNPTSVPWNLTRRMFSICCCPLEASSI